MRDVDVSAPETPDASSHGFVNEVNPLRYDGQPNEPNEVVGVLCDMARAFSTLVAELVLFRSTWCRVGRCGWSA